MCSVKVVVVVDSVSLNCHSPQLLLQRLTQYDELRPCMCCSVKVLPLHFHDHA